MKKEIKKVYVGLSGGVDSAVSAALLKRDGYEVIGVFIKAWTPPGFVCNWKEDRRSAMRVAAILNIPFITLDLEKEYKRDVVDYMISEYQKGRTPNPDVMCNKEIKFGVFLEFALKNGADFVATGHYAKVVNSQQIIDNSKNKKVNDYNLSSTIYNLCEGADKNKDQSYFLWTLTRDQLKHILFPIGHLEKPEVRKLAIKFDLPQATRKDSQGLCFLGKIDMKEFLSQYIKHKRGDVLNLKGEVIGHHEGVLFFTLGERHGFTITKKTSDHHKLYVVTKDIEKNTVTVASKITPQISKVQGASLCLKDVNLIGEIPKNKEMGCRFRYRQEKIPCKLVENRVVFETKQEAAAPGQSVVFYDGEVCLGGGVLDN